MSQRRSCPSRRKGAGRPVTSAAHGPPRVAGRVHGGNCRSLEKPALAEIVDLVPEVAVLVPRPERQDDPDRRRLVRRVRGWFGTDRGGESGQASS